MEGQKKKRPASLPQLIRSLIIQECLSGIKTSSMLAQEYGITRDSINKMVCRYRQRNSSNLADPIFLSIMSRKRSSKDLQTLQAENEALKKQLQYAKLKIEGFQIMGNILEEKYGIDLLKKSEGKPSFDSKSDTKE